jgi:hypothetical protein
VGARVGPGRSVEHGALRRSELGTSALRSQRCALSATHDAKARSHTTAGSHRPARGSAAKASSARSHHVQFINRGGGYAWRLCPKQGQLTEDCFQRGTLRYASNESWIQRGPDAANRTAIPAVRTSAGTFPAGSVWTKNPIPPCAAADGSPVRTPPDCPQPMFEPPLPGLYGDGEEGRIRTQRLATREVPPHLNVPVADCGIQSRRAGPGSCVTWAIHGPVEGYHTVYDSFGKAVLQGPVCTKQQGLDLAKQFQFNVFDRVVVPRDYAPGEYVLSFRYDAELSPQVWTHCSDITIV